MSGGAGTIGAGAVARVPRWGIRVIVGIGGAVAVATAISFAAEQPADEPAVIQPVVSGDYDERKPHGFGRTFTSDADGVRDPTYLPKR